MEIRVWYLQSWLDRFHPTIDHYLFDIFQSIFSIGLVLLDFFISRKELKKQIVIRSVRYFRIFLSGRLFGLIRWNSGFVICLKIYYLWRRLKWGGNLMRWIFCWDFRYFLFLLSVFLWNFFIQWICLSDYFICLWLVKLIICSQIIVNRFMIWTNWADLLNNQLL
jgi:hypothetical protein